MRKKIVEFNFTKDIYKAGGLTYIKREFFNRLWLEGLGIIFIILMTSVILLANKKLSVGIYALSIGAWIIFCIVCNVKIKRELMVELEKKVKAYQEQDMFGLSSLNTEDDGVILHMNNKTRKYGWKLIKNTKKIKGNLYIFISSVDYIFIPKEAFKETSIDHVIKEIRERRGPKKLREIINV